MGVPVLAKQNNSSPNVQPNSSSHRFPIHRLEDSPLIAAYTGTSQAGKTRSRSATPAQEHLRRNISPHSRPSTPGRPQTPVNPGEIVWEVKKEYISTDQQ